MIDEVKVKEVLRNVAIKFLSLPRTDKEVSSKLLKVGGQYQLGVGVLDDIVQSIISQLQSEGLLDDLHYAQTYFNQETTGPNPLSLYEIKRFLLRKGVPNEILSQVLGRYTRELEVSVIQKIVQKKKHNYTQDKLKAYLVRRGFSTATVVTVVDSNLTTNTI